MKMKKTKTIRQKKALFALAIVAVVAIGGTIAYHTSRGAFNNLFNLGYWQNETIETFDSPTDWKTCDVTPKTVVAKNTGNVPVAVRLKYEEYWKATGSTSTDHQTELPLLDGDSDPIAVVNLQNQADWEDGGDGYYYYKYSLAPGQESNSMFESVTLNCKNDFGGVNDNCTIVGNTKSCTKNNNQYEDATFHLYITVQYLQDGYQNVAGWTKEAEPSYFYHTLASLSKGVWEGTNVGSEMMIREYPESSTLGDKKIFYTFNVGQYSFKNYVAFAGYCWQFLHTTHTGGSKIIYSGTYNGSSCSTSNGSISTGLFNPTDYVGSNWDSYNNYAVSYDESSKYHSGGLRGVGYMYGNKEPWVYYSEYHVGDVVANSATWDGEKYNLSGTYTLADISGEDSIVENDHHYFCPDDRSATSCSEVAMMVDKSGSSSAHTATFGNMYYIVLENGHTKDSYAAAAFENVNDSNAKKILEQWFENNLLRKRNMLEDAIFCNDRTFATGPMYSDNSGVTYGSLFSSRVRVTPESHQTIADVRPMLDVCPTVRDSFTVSTNSGGNGKLRYPIGLLTRDEYTYYSVGWDMYSYTMTPNWYDGSSGGTGGHSLGGAIHSFGGSTMMSNQSNGKYRPVVSLKYETYLEKGDGSAENPWVIKE